MSTTIPVASQTFPTGDTTLHDGSLPAGISSAALTLDVSGINKSSGQELVFHVFVTDAAGDVREYFASFDGPWTDKQGALHNTSTMTVSFGSTWNGTQWVPITSTSAWSVKAVITAVNGPITSSSGSLVLN